MTGSCTIGVPASSASSAAATASIVATSPSIPIFTASTPRSSATARTCPAMISGSTGCTALTASVFCTVIAVIAVVPCTPARAKALRSAWIPAPPPESEPAIERTTGTRRLGTDARIRVARPPPVPDGPVPQRRVAGHAARLSECSATPVAHSVLPGPRRRKPSSSSSASPAMTHLRVRGRRREARDGVAAVLDALEQRAQRRFELGRPRGRRARSRRRRPAPRRARPARGG